METERGGQTLQNKQCLFYFALQKVELIIWQLFECFEVQKKTTTLKLEPIKNFSYQIRTQRPKISKNLLLSLRVIFAFHQCDGSWMIWCW